MRSDSEKELERLQEEFLLQSAGVAYEDFLFETFEQVGQDPTASGLPRERMKSIDAAVEAEVKKLRRRDSQKRLRANLLKVAACFVLLLVAVPSVAFSVKASRSGIVNYLIQHFSQFSEIHYGPDLKATAPLGWSSPYYPTWLPEGFSIYQVGFNENADTVWYNVPGEHKVLFSVLKNLSTGTAVNDEDLQGKSLQINGASAELYFNESGTERMLVLPLPRGVVQIRGEISEENIIKIAESIEQK